MKKSDPTDRNVHGQAAAQQFEAEYSRDEDLVLAEPLMVKDFRRLLADQTVKNWSQWATVAGFIPVPFFDLAAISGVQIKMIYDLCKVYDIPFEQRQVRAILSGLDWLDACCGNSARDVLRDHLCDRHDIRQAF
jgi:hypothetical protein